MNTIERAMRLVKGGVDAAPVTPREIERPVLEVDLGALRRRGFLVPDAASSSLSEQFQQVKRRLIDNLATRTASAHRAANLVMITSALPGEGKTWFCLNLAMSLAREIDRTVLAIDSDGVNSGLGRLLGVTRRPGLYEALADPALDLGDLILRTNVPTLSFLPAGVARDTVTERLASQAMVQLAQEIAARYPDRLVLFDAPPVLAASGAAALAAHVGQVVLVVEAGRTTADTLRRTVGMLAHTEISGAVLNKVRTRPRPLYAARPA